MGKSGMLIPSPVQESTSPSNAPPAATEREVTASAEVDERIAREERREFHLDGLFWRRFGYLGATRGPVWFQRAGPGLVAAIVFALSGENRRGAVANLRGILGTGGWLRDHLRALRLFSEFAYCTTDVWQYEAAQEASDVERDIEVVTPPEFDVERVLPGERGLVVVTSHFGTWEVGARVLKRFGRPVHLVMSAESNPTVEEFQRTWRERYGLNVIRSDSSPFSSLNMIQALRRGDVVAMQLDRAVGDQVTREVEFFGRPAPFSYGPFVLARMAEVPIWPVFVARLGRGRYRLLAEALRTVPRDGGEEAALAVMRDVVQSFERHVREYPHQWFQFRRVWRE
jgi:lauroyl/myristoyl acyltransferase